MKKIVLIFAVGAFMLTPGKTQAQAVEQGNILIDTYYGFPNLYTALLEGLYANSGSEQDISIKGIGPLGGRFEYMAADKIGVGFEINYANSSVGWNEASVDTGGSTVQYSYEVSSPVVRAMARLNWHFAGSDSFDAYASFGAGYRTRKWKFESTDPDYGDQSIESLIPLAMRLSVGARYFFTDNIGLGLELGLGGGGLVHGGLAFKF
jgi:opacity protein-like surface antigen